MSEDAATPRALWAQLTTPALYYIHTLAALDRPGIAALYRCASGAVQGGCRLIQLRFKGAWSPEVAELLGHLLLDFDGSDCLFLLNDRVEWARETGAHGVHVGLSEGDTDPLIARRVLGAEGILGVTAKTAEARAQAIDARADYVSWGALFPSQTKAEAIPGALEEIAGIRAGLPPAIKLCVIGGIDASNVARVARESPDLIAIGGAIQRAADPELETIKLLDTMRLAREVSR